MADNSTTNQYTVLHLGKFYPPHNGGIETHLRYLAVQEARHANVNVLVANTVCRNEHSILEGVKVKRVARWGTVASMPICPGLTQAIRRSSADLVHMHVPNPGAAFSFLSSGHRGKLAITHHADTMGRETLRRLSDRFVRAAMERASVIIATSHRYLDSSPELAPYREKCRVIPLGINVDPLIEGEHRIEEATDSGERPSILAIGRLVPYKGFDVLIRAMDHVDANLTLIGTGPQAPQLQALIDTKGLQKRIRLLGRVDDLRPYFKAASAFVMPSVTRAEAFGIVQIEAMAAGLPVINTDIDSGVPEVSLDGKTGLTVTPGDEYALAEAIQLLLSRSDLREQFGRAAKERVLREFTADRMVERTIAVYAEVLSEH
ncbi:MAG TPA: glycosyltransferase [Verrucomicrobiae bacterium]|nr:glycosyltransferase [Verrucomicrobiae bacterium]